ncbi:hypothetical protein ACFWPV_05030 [Streptomyces uncialis]|uniref:hypothetical protein n=1 Tax=Streptomyces uncialis TaxID=1048205 RepID=UPI003661B883
MWVYPPGTERQIVSLGRWRQRTKDLGVLRVLLWLEGFPIGTSAARSSLVAALHTAEDTLRKHITPSPAPAAAPGSAAGQEPIASLAAELASKRGPDALPRPIRQSAADRVRSVELLLRTFGLGEVPTASDSEAFEIERLLGVAPGRRHKVDGAGPWLTGSPHDLLSAGLTLALPVLAQTMETASDSELEEARPFARSLFHLMPLAARLIGATHGNDNHAGFGGIAHLDEEPELGPLMVAVTVGMRRTAPEMADNLAAIHASLQSVPDAMASIKALLDMPQAVVDQNLAGQPVSVRHRIDRVVEAALEGRIHAGPHGNSSTT